jgi:hypothetical protein
MPEGNVDTCGVGSRAPPPYNPLIEGPSFSPSSPTVLSYVQDSGVSLPIVHKKRIIPSASLMTSL